MSLAEHGFELLSPRELPAGAFDLVASLQGVRPRMAERQPIRPVAGGRSFASTQGFTPLHTDSQDFLGAPPGLQVMVCRRPARQGGETLLVDGWMLLDQVRRADPSLYAALFSETRTIPFYFGAVRGPTVASKGGAPVLTHSPMPPTDAVGRALAPHLAHAPVHEVRVEAGEILLVDNHRMLHGRTAFDDPARDFLRVLAWLEKPLSQAHFSQPLRGVALPAYDTPGPREHAVVTELTAGVPPAKLAAREAITEAQLYRWRSAVFAASSR